MLENQKWVRFEDDILTEWQQARDEGRLVDEYKDACVELSAQPESDSKSAFSAELFDRLSAPPLTKPFRIRSRRVGRNHSRQTAKEAFV